MPSCWVKIEVSAPLSSASSIMRGPAIGVAVGVEPAPEAPFAHVEPLSSGDYEESTAKTPPTTRTNKSRAAANSKRRLRFRLRGGLPPPLLSGTTGEIGRAS